MNVVDDISNEEMVEKSITPKSDIEIVKNDGESVNHLLDKVKDCLTCFICHGGIQNAVVLKCCGRLSCKECTDKWFMSQRVASCPYCRNASDGEYIVSEPITTISKLAFLLEEPNMSYYKCDKHSKSIEYYCKNCKESLCGDCLFESIKDGTHNGHQLFKATDLMQKYKHRLKISLAKLEKEVTYLGEYASRARTHGVEFTASFVSFGKKVEKEKESLKNLITNYGDEFKEKMQSLSKQAKRINECLNLYYEYLYSGETECLQNAKQITTNGEFKKEISLPVAKVFNPLVPNYRSFKIEIPHFPQKVDEYSKLPQPGFIYTERIKFNGNTWRAKIYPNGNGNGVGSHIAVFIELTKGTPDPRKYHYRIDIVPNQQDKSTKTIYKTYASEFIENDTWGWNKVAMLSELRKSRFLGKEDTLVIYLSIKADYCYQDFEDIERKCQHYQKKIMEMKDILEDEE